MITNLCIYVYLGSKLTFLALVILANQLHTVYEEAFVDRLRHDSSCHEGNLRRYDKLMQTLNYLY